MKVFQHFVLHHKMFQPIRLKSKKDVNRHHIWDSVCGTFGEEPNEKKFVKIAVSSELSVIGVNCQELIDENILEKRAR